MRRGTRTELQRAETLLIHATATCDRGESEIDRNLLARWPVWGAAEVSRLRDLVARLNRACLDLIGSPQGGTAR